MSSATEVLLNIAETAIINTAKITVVSFNPREDDLLIIYLIYFLTYINVVEFMFSPLLILTFSFKR